MKIFELNEGLPGPAREVCGHVKSRNGIVSDRKFKRPTPPKAGEMGTHLDMDRCWGSCRVGQLPPLEAAVSQAIGDKARRVRGRFGVGIHLVLPQR